MFPAASPSCNLTCCVRCDEQEHIWLLSAVERVKLSGHLMGRKKRARQTAASHVLMTCQSNTRCVHLLCFSASPRQLI